jgi:hypothetical protein
MAVVCTTRIHMVEEGIASGRNMEIQSVKIRWNREKKM